MEPEDIAQSFRILRTCQNKFDCLIFEMFFIQELKLPLSLDLGLSKSLQLCTRTEFLGSYVLHNSPDLDTVACLTCC